MGREKRGLRPAIKAVIFDGGGTIWDSSESLYESYIWGFRQLGVALPLSPRICHNLRGLRNFNTALGIAKALLWASKILGDKGSVLFLERPNANEYLMKEVQNFSRENASFLSEATHLAQAFDEYLYNKVREETYPLLPNAAKILEKLHAAGYQLTLVTIRRSLSARRILAYHGLRGYFSHILSTESLPEGGKSLDAATEAVKRLMIPPTQILWVGDSGTDVSCAKGAGMLAAGVLTGLANRQTLLDEGADWVLKNLSGLSGLLGIDH